MSKPRLGRAERQIVRAWHEARRAKKQAIIIDNLSKAPEPTYHYRSSSVYSATPRIVISDYGSGHDWQIKSDGMPKVSQAPKGYVARHPNATSAERARLKAK